MLYIYIYIYYLYTYIYIYIYIYEAVYVLHRANNQEKGMNPTTLPTVIDK